MKETEMIPQKRWTTFEEVVDWMEGKTKHLKIYGKKQRGNKK